MNLQNQSSNPQNIVSNIVGKKIYLENMTTPMIDVVKEVGAKQMAYGAKLIWLIECADENGVIETLRELNQQGFLFEGGSSGYPAADVFALLLDKKKLKENFREVSWRTHHLIHFSAPLGSMLLSTKSSGEYLIESVRTVSCENTPHYYKSEFE
ncbi:MAG TPA: hypothetical protein VJ987_12745 [Anaerolineales bacterium]|nr:hypothetical protein [Anaerolineales bacterium]